MATQAIRLATTRVSSQLVRTQSTSPARLPNPAVLFFRKTHFIPLRIWAGVSAITVASVLASVGHTAHHIYSYTGIEGLHKKVTSPAYLLKGPFPW